MSPRASILRSRWHPGGPSETPRAYFGGLGGDVGARGGLLEAPRRALWSSRGGLGIPRERSMEHFGLFWGVILAYLFRARWQLESSSILLLLQTCFYVFPDFAKMTDIVPDS